MVHEATIYEVWDHAWLDAPESIPDIDSRSTTLAFGYWILELDEPTKVTGYYRYLRHFSWEKRDGPYLEPEDYYNERHRPGRRLDFGDFPKLPFERSLEVVVELQRMRDRQVGYRTPDEVFAPEDAPLNEQIDALQRAFSEFLSWEYWGLKYRVTNEYCRSLRAGLRRWL